MSDDSCTLLLRENPNAPHQLVELKIYVSTRGWRVDRVYRDVDADTAKRGFEWQQFIDHVASGQCDRVAVWTLGHLGQTLEEIIYAVTSILSRSIDLHLVSDLLLVRMGSPSGQLLMHTLVGLSQLQHAPFIVPEKKREPRPKDEPRSSGRPRAEIPEEDLIAIRDERETVATIAAKHALSPVTVKRHLRRLK